MTSSDRNLERAATVCQTFPGIIALAVLALVLILGGLWPTPTCRTNVNAVTGTKARIGTAFAVVSADPVATENDAASASAKGNSSSSTN